MTGDCLGWYRGMQGVMRAAVGRAGGQLNDWGGDGKDDRGEANMWTVGCIAKGVGVKGPVD